MENEIKWIRIFMSIIVFCIIVLVLKNLKAIFIPFIFALLLYFFFSPFNRFLHKHGTPKPIAMILTLLIIFITLTLLGTLVYTGVSTFVVRFPIYEEKMINLTKDILLKLDSPITDVRSFLKYEVNWFSIIDRFSLTEIVSSTMGTFVDFLFKLALTLIFMMFIMSEKERLGRRFAKAITPDEAVHSNHMIIIIEKQVQTYLLNKTLISAVTAICGMIVMWIFRVDFIIIGGLLLFLLNFIPNIGSVIACFFPIMVYFFEFGFDWKLVLMSSLLILIQMTFGNVVEPKLMGTELRISPLIILLSIIFWAWLWGPVGMIIAVPITSAINILLKESKSLKLISAIMSDE